MKHNPAALINEIKALNKLSTKKPTVIIDEIQKIPKWIY